MRIPAPKALVTRLRGPNAVKKCQDKAGAEPFPLPPRTLVIPFPEKVPHDFLAAESHFRIPAFSPVP
jgi:hypothetical protein